MAVVFSTDDRNYNFAGYHAHRGWSATHKLDGGRWVRLDGGNALHFLPHGQGPGALGGNADLHPDIVDCRGRYVRVERDHDGERVIIQYPDADSRTWIIGSVEDVQAFLADRVLPEIVAKIARYRAEGFPSASDWREEQLLPRMRETISALPLLRDAA